MPQTQHRDIYHPRAKGTFRGLTTEFSPAPYFGTIHWKPPSARGRARPAAPRSSRWTRHLSRNSGAPSPYD